jgi:hypothetical protein
MSEFSIESAVEGGLQRALAGPVFRNRPSEQTIAVDVGASATKAEITRGGFTVAEVPVDLEGIATFLDDRPVVATKVVTQSIAPGTAVAIGTAIDMVITSTSDLPVRVVPGIHHAFEGLTMAQLYEQFSGEPRVRDILRTKSTPAELTSDDIASLTAVLQSKNIQVGTGAGETVGSAFTALQAAFTFQG